MAGIGHGRGLGRPYPPAALRELDPAEETPYKYDEITSEGQRGQRSPGAAPPPPAPFGIIPRELFISLFSGPTFVHVAQEGIENFTEGVGNTVDVLDYAVPQSQAFVLTDYQSYAWSQANEQLTRMGAASPHMFIRHLRWDLTVTGGFFPQARIVSSAFGFASTALSAVWRPLSSIFDSGGASVGTVVREGGRVQVRNTQIRAFPGGASIPDQIGCKIAGFLCPPQVIERWLRVK